jgi:pimeloyl-ACP methyl ester carboxylesterase
MWRPQLEGLAGAFRVVAVDLPAHGALADLPFRLEDAADLVAAVIDEEAGGRAIVVGSSLGGYVAIDLAARHPRRVGGLVLAGATAEPRAIARRAPRTVGSYLIAAAGERLLGGAVRPGDDGDGTEPPPTNGWLFKGGTRALVAALGMTFLPRLASYPGPVLIVNGATDAIFRRAEERFVAAARHGRLVVIPGTGHLANEEQPLAFNLAIREFAAAVAASDAARRA